jgi:hypothetical protein
LTTFVKYDIILNGENMKEYIEISTPVIGGQFNFIHIELQTIKDAKIIKDNIGNYKLSIEFYNNYIQSYWFYDCETVMKIFDKIYEYKVVCSA